MTIRDLFKLIKDETQEVETGITIDVMTKASAADPLVQYPPEHEWVAKADILDIYMHVDGAIHIEVEVRGNESSD